MSYVDYSPWKADADAGGVGGVALSRLRMSPLIDANLREYSANSHRFMRGDEPAQANGIVVYTLESSRLIFHGGHILMTD